MSGPHRAGDSLSRVVHSGPSDSSRSGSRTRSCSSSSPRSRAASARSDSRSRVEETRARIDKLQEDLPTQFGELRERLASSGAPDEVRDKILSNLSERARENFVEEIELLGPVRLSMVEDARAQVVQAIRQLEESGQIVIRREGEDEYVA